MRFYRYGPIIPDILLNRRDDGRVVFLCGAGVSFNSGLPSFVGLTRHVFKYFDPPENSQLSISFKPWDERVDGPKDSLDQIFHMLYQEYGKNDVNAVVAERLQQKGASVTESNDHRTIARISSDLEGNPQIVTTNFDRLFENVNEGSKLSIYEPPALPDIRHGVPINGITYLHGRLQEPNASHHPYVLSSADLGRAYLSEGWATNFIQSLLDRYTVVLVGYQAEDLPVKYLLQGLSHDGLSDRSSLYAFDKGNFEEIEVKWRDRGVTPIAYNDHSDLWKSLEAWAERADDPRVWRSKLVDLAMSGPREVSAHERGQVAHLVRTTAGAKLFACAEPSPPAEWLCVFDASCRAADISKGFGEDAEAFDPLEVYGLDDDPPRPKNARRDFNWINDHILQWHRGDTNPTTLQKIGDIPAAGFEDMPSRLLHLSKWIVKKLDSPIGAWWALRQNRLHPRIVHEIHFSLRRKPDLHPKARRIWGFILDHQPYIRNFLWDDGWYDFKDRLKIEGWSLSLLREFEDITKPVLSHILPLGVEASRPPFNDWENTELGELTNWKIKFLNTHGDKIEIPDELLIPVFRIAETNLHRAADLLEDLGTIYFYQLTCYPDRDVDGNVRDLDANFIWFLELFEKMVANHPKIARAYSIMWPVDKKYYFRMLKLFALNHVDLFTGDESAEIVISLDQDCFWDVVIRRELLFLIHDRWKEFSNYNKSLLVERLLNGPDNRNDWSEEKSQSNKRKFACRYTRWLVLQGCELSTKQEIRLNEMIERVPDWNDSWALSFVTEYYGRSGWVEIDEAPDTLINLPVDKVVKQAIKDHHRDTGSFKDKRSFVGLVKSQPSKALEALLLSASKGDYPQDLWETLIKDWPEDTAPQLFCRFLRGLGQLPENIIQNIRHTIVGWIRYRFQSAYQIDKDLSWSVFDYLVYVLVMGGYEAAVSSIEEVLERGEVYQNSRRTYEHTINGPIGEVADGLLSAISSLNLNSCQEIPGDFKERIEKLLGVPGEGRDQAIVRLAHDFSWLYYIDPNWVIEQVIPWFSFEHADAEPAWSGYLWGVANTPPDIHIALKPYLLGLFPRIYKWSWDDYPAENATKYIVDLAVFRGDKPDGISPCEARQCLRNMNDKNRRDAVFHLGRIGKHENNGWSDHVIPFFEWVWPKEHRFRTSSLVTSLVSILEDAGGDFPAVLSAVRKFLVPVEGDRLQLYRFSQEVGEDRSLAIEYPEKVLGLLDAIVPNSTDNLPYELEQILELVVEYDTSLVRDRRYLRLIDLIDNK